FRGPELARRVDPDRAVTAPKAQERPASVQGWVDPRAAECSADDDRHAEVDRAVAGARPNLARHRFDPDRSVPGLNLEIGLARNVDGDLERAAAPEVPFEARCPGDELDALARLPRRDRDAAGRDAP